MIDLPALSVMFELTPDVKTLALWAPLYKGWVGLKMLKKAPEQRDRDGDAWQENLSVVTSELRGGLRDYSYGHES